MKKILLLSLIVSGLWISGCASFNTTSSKDDSERYEEPVANSKLNNKRLEKNLSRFSEELNLSKRQQKQLKKIDKRYARLDRKLSRKENSKRRDHRQLASQKREEILQVLTSEQQQKLEGLVKKGRFSFDQWFGK
jgi:Spy/CpxP family protein refolding chaperone